MSLFAIGIGGTGSKCIEALVQLTAVGLLENPNESIYTLFVDPDETNGNLERSRLSLSRYSSCYSLFENEPRNLPWVRTQLFSFGLWSPFSQTTTDKQLRALFGYDSLKRSEGQKELGDLFDVLFTSEEKEAALDVGFRGRPAIGSAVMSQIDLDNLDEEVWRQFIERIKNDVGSGAEPKIMLFGSIFGGTGASGLPTIGRLLDERLKNDNVRDKVPISCVFLLPYFSFTPSGKLAPDEVYARSDQFLLNTEAALRYYLDQSQPFNTVYLLGNQNPSEVSFSLGKQTQTNQPHFIELYAALAARHFLNNPQANEKTRVSLISRQTDRRVSWQDLPDTEVVQARLATAARFAYAWISNIEPELARAKEIGVGRFQREAPWFVKFFQPASSGFIRKLVTAGEDLADFNAPEEQQGINTVGSWCRDFLRWLSAIHQYRNESIELFRTAVFSDLLSGANNKNADELSQLVVGIAQDQSRQSQDTLANLKLRLDEPSLPDFGNGTTGLAKALYYLCQVR